MRGLLNGKWHEIERWPEAEAWLGRPHYTLTDDPEAGGFDADHFEQIEETAQ